MRVSEIMTNAAVIDQPDDTLAEAARKMWEQQTGSLLVMDGDDLVGIVTERDVLKAVATGMAVDDTRISQVMSKDLVTVGPGTSLREAAKVMAERWIRGDLATRPERSPGRCPQRARRPQPAHRGLRAGQPATTEEDRTRGLGLGEPRRPPPRPAAETARTPRSPGEPVPCCPAPSRGSRRCPGWLSAWPRPPP